MGACPIYKPQDNPEAHYLHVCVFCGQHEVSETPPQAEVNVYWEPVDRFRILADTTAVDRSYVDEKRQVSFSSASRFFRAVRNDRRFRKTRNLAPLGIALLTVLTLASIYMAVQSSSGFAGQFSASSLAGWITAGVVIGAVLTGLWLTHWRRRYSLSSVLMLQLYPFSLELETLLQHAGKVSQSGSVAKALKTMVQAQQAGERSAS